MTTDPMTKAVEAAAKAMIRIRWPDSEPITPEDRRVAQAAINAVLPILRAQFAEEVDRAIDEIVADINDADRIRDRDLLIRIRAAIARNWGTK